MSIGDNQPERLSRDAPERLKKNEYWGRRSGMYDKVSDSYMFKSRSRGKPVKGNAPKKKSYHALLVQQAMAKGYLNGIKL